MKQPCADYLESITRRIGPVLNVLSVAYNVHYIASKMFEVTLRKEGEILPAIKTPVHPSMSPDDISAVLNNGNDEDAYWMLDEIDKKVRRNVQEAMVSEDAKELVSIFPDIVGMYTASGMLAPYLEEIRRHIAEHTTDFDKIGWSFKTVVAAMTVIASKHPVRIVMAHLAGLAIDALLKKEEEIAASIDAKFQEADLPEGYLRYQLDQAVTAKDVLKTSALLVYMWRRMVLTATEYVNMHGSVSASITEWSRVVDKVKSVLKSRGVPKEAVDSI